MTIIHFDLPVQVCRERVVKRTGHPTLDADFVDMAIGSYLRDLTPPDRDECDELLVLTE